MKKMLSVRTLLTGTGILGLGLLYLLLKNDSSQSLPLPVFFSADCHSQSSASVLFYPLHPLLSHHLTSWPLSLHPPISGLLLDLQHQHPSTRMVTVPMPHMSEPSQSGPLTSKTPQLPSLADGWTQSLSKFGVDSHSLVFLCLYRRWRKPRWQRLKSTRLASTTGRLRRGLPYCTS